MGCYIWYSEEGPERAAGPPSRLLAVPNVTAHPSAASVPITVLLYDGPLLCGFNVAIKGLSTACKCFCLFVVCCLKRVHKMRFPQKNSNFKLRSLLPTNRKSYMGFSQKRTHSWTPWMTLSRLVTFSKLSPVIHSKPRPVPHSKPREKLHHREIYAGGRAGLTPINAPIR